MKRRSIISAALAASILASMAGTLSADSASGSTYYDSQYFNWTVDGSTLCVNPTSNPSSSNISFTTGYGDSIYSMYTGDYNNNVNYTFGGFDENFPNLTYLRIKYYCEEFGGFSNCPALKKIDIFGNLRDEITLDFDEADYDVLPSITITESNPDILVKVDLEGFENTSVTIPASYGSADNNICYDFGRNTALESVTFEEGTEVIRHSAFLDCDDLEGVNIPDGVTLIEYEAFEGCDSLCSIEIPASVTEIKYDAFKDSELSTIYYDGTTSQWYGLVSERNTDGSVINNVLNVNGVTVHCTNGNMYIRRDSDGKYRQAPIGWFLEDDGWRYYVENGAVVTGVFVPIDDGIYAFDSTGLMLTGWQRSGDWFYFKSSGKMATGWTKIGGKWYYFENDGRMVTGWQKIGSSWYYFKSSGVMATGWQKISNKWYYLGTDGKMVTGWQKIGSSWYYFQSSGVMKTGWQKSGGSWYYLDSNGAMLTNCSRKIGNKTYNFNANGVCTNP